MVSELEKQGDGRDLATILAASIRNLRLDSFYDTENKREALGLLAEVAILRGDQGFYGRVLAAVNADRERMRGGQSASEQYIKWFDSLPSEIVFQTVKFHLQYGDWAGALSVAPDITNPNVRVDFGVEMLRAHLSQERNFTGGEIRWLAENAGVVI